MLISDRIMDYIFLILLFCVLYFIQLALITIYILYIFLLNKLTSQIWESFKMQ